MLLKKRFKTLIWLCLSAGLLFSSSVFAVQQIQVVALFKHKAMIEIDGSRHLLREGQVSPEGIKLISATPEEAVLEIDGKSESFGLGGRAGGTFAKRDQPEVKIWRAANGAYHTVGTINGRMTNMMVDTGATSVAMSEVEAKRLGIPYRLKGKKGGVSTASGFARAYTVMLDKVQVGSIALRQVEAFVVEGSSPTEVLLGMTFLNRVEMRNEGNLMILRGKF